MQSTLLSSAILFVLLSTLKFTPLLSQATGNLLDLPPHFEHFKLPDGRNKVLKIIQDSTGFLWFASHGGLVRYDGQRFVTFRSDSLNENSPATDLLEYLYQDSHGVFWLAHIRAGLTSFDPISEKFVRYDIPLPDSNVVNGGWTHSVVEDREGYIWAGTNHGVYRLDRKSGVFKRFSHDKENPRSLSHDVAKVVYVDRQGTLWIGTGYTWAEKRENRGKKPGGLNRYHPETESFDRFIHDPNDPFSLHDNRIGAIFEDSRGVFWVGTWADGLHQMDRTKGTFTHFPYNPQKTSQLSRPYKQNIPIADQSNSWVTFIGEDQKNRIWIGAWNGGLNVYDPTSGKMSHFENKIEDPTSLPTNNIFDFFETSNGTLFYNTTSMHIVFKLNEETNKFPFKDIRSILKTQHIKINSITEDASGIVWLGTEGMGLIRFNPQNDNIKVFKFDPNNSNSITSNSVTNVLPAHDGLLWITTIDGLNCLNPSTFEIKRYQYEGSKKGTLPYYSGIPSIRPVFQDRYNNIWVPTFGPRGGLNLLDRKTGLFENITLGVEGFESDRGDLCEDQKGNIWMAALSGIVSYDPQTEKTKLFKLPKEMVGAIEVESDVKGRIWFRSGSNELGLLDPISGLVKSFSKENSQIHADKIYSLLKSTDGRIWMNSLNALQVLDPNNETFNLYPAPPIAPNNPKFLNSKGILFLADNGGYYSFHPDDIQFTESKLPPRILISDLILDGERIIPGTNSILSQPIWATKTLDLSHDQNSFSLGIACIDYRDPTSHQFNYKLENYESDWRNDIQEGLVNYRTVPPGTYTFKVKGADSRGIWNDKGAELTITIHPPWWETWWARGLFGLLLITILYFIRYFELKKQERKLVLEQDKLAFQKEVNAATSKFVPTAFLHSLGRKDIMDVQLGDAVEQEVTVMFSDIRGYTTISESMTPEENFGFVNAFNQRMGPVIQTNNGFVNQYLGDGIMALFQNSAEDGLHAAIGMQKELTKFNQLRKAKNLNPIQLGIGLHSGPLIMGIIGDEKRMDPAIISNTVNTASRIESLTKYFKTKVLLSAESRNDIKMAENFYFRYLGKVQLKGKKDPTGIFECINCDQRVMMEKKLETYKLFENGMNMYFEGEFTEAIMSFEKILSVNPEDQPVQLFRNKSYDIIANGTPKNWTGVEIMRFK